MGESQYERSCGEGTHDSMPRKVSGEENVKQKGRSKSDKARRGFELHGTYSAKHLRLREEQLEKQRARHRVTISE